MVGMSENTHALAPAPATGAVTAIDLSPDAPVYRHIAALRAAQADLAQRYAVKLMGIFGSYARNSQRPDSDIDVLVSFTDTPTLIDFIRLEDELSGLLGAQVDLVLDDELKPRIRERVERETIVL
jgi:predicted nucleotidyltransferase